MTGNTGGSYEDLSTLEDVVPGDPMGTSGLMALQKLENLRIDKLKQMRKPSTKGLNLPAIPGAGETSWVWGSPWVLWCWHTHTLGAVPHPLLKSMSCPIESHQRIIERPGLIRITMLIQFQPPAMCRVTNQQTRLPRATSSLAWNACRDGASTPPWATCSVPHHPLGEKLPPHIQPKPPLS